LSSALPSVRWCSDDSPRTEATYLSPAWVVSPTH
jgi:hypothetical protein